MENIPGQLDSGSQVPPGLPIRKDETSTLRLFDRCRQERKKKEEERKEVIEVSLLSVMVWQLQEIEGRDRNRSWWEVEGQEGWQWSEEGWRWSEGGEQLIDTCHAALWDLRCWSRTEVPGWLDITSCGATWLPPYQRTTGGEGALSPAISLAC